MGGGGRGLMLFRIFLYVMLCSVLLLGWMDEILILSFNGWDIFIYGPLVMSGCRIYLSSSPLLVRYRSLMR